MLHLKLRGEQHMQKNSNNLLLKIGSSINDLRPSEQKIAQYVVHNYQDVIYQTVSELASNSGVSEASVMRFVKTLGFKGFQYFKLSLANIPDNNDGAMQSLLQDDSAFSVKTNIRNNIITSINDTATVLEDDSLNKAVNFILKAKQIFLVGVGSSGIIARLLSYKLLRIGIISKYISDSHLQTMHSSLLDKRSLLIGISHSGSTIDTVDALRIAYEGGAKTICITDHIKSPIVKYSNVLLCTYAREDPLGVSQGTSSASQIYVIETLLACLYNNVKEHANLARKKTAESVLKKMY
ncbi:MAG TPA: hypothetical protein DEB05_08145 [Firmicutes bacterium]|jgi:DNA-binding MurR/RpiR family transcriptional regulator|nr:hypothetical protein [Bacillota bacterium]HBT16908.1 hypothetical protein [Bacillota bacterium]